MNSYSNIENVFKVNAKVFLEGIEVPYSSVSVSYGIDSEPSCTIALPGNMTLRELPDFTNVHILYKDPQAEDDSSWYVLFDGELEGWNYGVDSNSATITFNAVHGTHWLNLMQLMIQEATAKVSGMSDIDWSGANNPAAYKINGLTYSEAILLDGLFPNVKEQKTSSVEFKTMADLIYCIIRSMLSSELYGAETTTFFRNEIENIYNLHNRIFGLSSKVESIFNKLIAAIKKKHPTEISAAGKLEESDNYGKAKPDEEVVLPKVSNVKVEEKSEGTD